MTECLRKTQKKPIRGGWVDVNKGDDQVEVYRSRYAAMELHHQCRRAVRDGPCAANVACRHGRKLTHKLMVIDISKAETTALIQPTG